MRFILYSLICLSLLWAKDRNYKRHQQHQNQDFSQITSRHLLGNQNNGRSGLSQISRDDTSTVWLADFEGDVSDWIIGEGWNLTEESSYSPTHSFNIDDDNYDIVSSLISPILSLPELGGADEIYKMNFALWCDLPDFDGDGDNFLEDYYWVDIANVSDVPVYFHTTTSNAYEGNSWWCGDGAVGGYLDAWVQFLDSPPITIDGPGYYMSCVMKWGIEDPAGATVGGTCTDGWDAANVRISTDGGSTWESLIGSDPYDFDYGYGWIYNDDEYDCGGSLEAVATGWGGQADWHDVVFELGAYAGEEVIIRFAFGSDPAYSTPDDPALTGFQIDNIEVVGSDGEIVFTDNADDLVNMTPQNGLEFAWEQFFYDYGDFTRPGGGGWAVYQPGDPFNGNTQLDISNYAGSDVRVRFTGRMDDNEDGGNGSGLYIDDVHIWKVEINEAPMVQNVMATAGDATVHVIWDMPPGGTYDNDDIIFDDGTFEDAIWMESGTSIMGEFFDMPYGVEAVVANSVYVFGDDPLSGPTTLYGYDVVGGMPLLSPTYQTDFTTVAGQWTELDLGWSFLGDFVLAIEVTTTIGISIDADNSPSTNSWANLGGWEPWYDIAIGYGLTDGEFGIRANVTTVGGLTPEFNVYRSADGGPFNTMFNGQNLSENEYIDNFVQNGLEYCYGITTVYGEEESDMTEPVCATPEPNTIYEIAYDDGTNETSTNVGANNFLAVKFTPNNYPVDIYSARIFSVGAQTGVSFLSIWDDDGEDGMPGTPLLENIAMNLNAGWNEQSIYDFNVTVEEGSFYVGYQEMPGTPAVGVDADSPADHSIVDLGIGNGWENFGNYFDGALMVRAEVDSANAVVGIDDLITNIPESFGLNQNYPNPFNPVTTIQFDLAEPSEANLMLYNLLGKKVQTVVARYLNAGTYRFGVYAGDLPSGMYIYRLTAKNKDGKALYNSSRKLVLMK